FGSPTDFPVGSRPCWRVLGVPSQAFLFSLLLVPVGPTILGWCLVFRCPCSASSLDHTSVAAPPPCSGYVPKCATGLSAHSAWRKCPRGFTKPAKSNNPE